jgi:hypothetical protein
LSGASPASLQAEQRREVLGVPFAGEIEAALLHPAVEVGRDDAVGDGEGRMPGDEERDGRLLVGHAEVRQVARELELVRGELRRPDPVRRVVLLDDVPPAST